MTSDDLRTWLEHHELTQGGLARLAGVNRRTARRWCAGAQPIPTALLGLLERATPDEIEDARG